MSAEIKTLNDFVTAIDDCLRRQGIYLAMPVRTHMLFRKQGRLVLRVEVSEGECGEASKDFIERIARKILPPGGIDCSGWSYGESAFKTVEVRMRTTKNEPVRLAM